MSDPPSPISEHATPLPTLTSVLLISALKPLYPIPRKNQPTSSRPTQATLRSFLLQIPPAQHAIPPADNGGQQELTKDVVQRKFARDLGLVALWSAEQLDERVREESKGQKEGAAPVLPVNAPPLILTLLSHTITHVLQPLFLQSFPPPPPPPPAPSSSSSRFTEILPEVHPSPQELAVRLDAKNDLEIILARVLNLAVVRPVTDVAKLVRDGGVVRSVIKMAVALGWEGSGERRELQQLVVRVLDSFRPTLALGLVSPLLSANVFPSHITKVAGSLMTRALLRPGGVEGVLQGVFGGLDTGREESDAGKKALSVAKVLSTVPGGMDAEEYYSLLIPRLISFLISPTTPSTYLRPLSLTLTTLLSHPSPLVSKAAQNILLPYIHAPLLSPHAHQNPETFPSAAFNALTLLLPLVLLTPPSALSHSILLEPILPQLFGLHWHLQQSRTADPVLRREVEGCLRSWGRVGEEHAVRRGMEDVVRSGRGWEGGQGSVLPGEGVKDVEEEKEEKEWYWEGGGEDLKIIWGCPSPVSSPPGVLVSSSSTGLQSDVESQTLALLSLHPPPPLFLAYVKSLDRPSLAGDLFVSLLTQLDSRSSLSSLGDNPLLEEYEQEDPRHRVLVMQLVLSMVDSMGETLVKGEEGRVLAFVNHVLASSIPKQSSSSAKGKARDEETGEFGLDSLRIVEDEDEEAAGDESDGLDSDDEVELPVDEDEEGAEGMFGLGGGEEGEEKEEGAEIELDGGKLGLVGTAIGLLVAVLQANESLSPRTSPVLTLIQSSLAHHLASPTPSIRHLTREARLIISIREATTSSSTFSSASAFNPSDAALVTLLDSYRQALKLVQDPLVPVRAHGLIILRQLVLPPAQQRRERPRANPPTKPSTSDSALTSEPEKSLLPPALVPAILNVFLQSVQDPDSYVYLNAVKGLSALVDGWGKDVLTRMIAMYAKGVGNGGWEGVGLGGEMQRAELDARLRAGEALCGVVERSEKGLGVHAATLIPPLLLTFRASNLPTALRASALTILTLIASTSPLTIAPYASDLVRACVDLLQVESVPPKPSPSFPQNLSSPTSDPDAAFPLPDEHEPLLSPLLSNPKHPILRRAALHFLSSVLRADSDELGTEAVEGEVWRRAGVVVGYVQRTDGDGVVRGLAGDVKGDLRRTVVGGE